MSSPKREDEPLRRQVLSRRSFTQASLATLVSCARPPRDRVSLPPTQAPPVEEPHTAKATIPPAVIEPPLFRIHPTLRERLPWVSLGTFPTPVERAVSLGRHLGIDALWIKRDDISGAIHGGGKVRKLEFLLGDAARKEAETVVTFGGVGSNHAVATAIYAAKLGMHAELLLLPEPPDDRVRAHLLADLAAGADLRLAHERATFHDAPANRNVERYTIPTGGSSPLGNVGFVNAAFELKDQTARGEMPEPDVVYMAMGTMGAAVGLAIGLRAAGLRTRLLAVRASSPGTSSEARLLAMAAETESYLRGLDPSFPRIELRPGDVTLAGGYLGSGYGRPTEKGLAAIKLAHDTSQLELEHVYTGKALAALIDDAPHLSGSVVLFWNTHNSRALPLGGLGPRDVPAAFQGYFAARSGAPRLRYRARSSGHGAAGGHLRSRVTHGVSAVIASRPAGVSLAKAVRRGRRPRDGRGSLHPRRSYIMTTQHDTDVKERDADIARAVKGSTLFLPRPAAVFQGYESVNGRGLSTAMVGTTNITGAKTKVTYRVCMDIESLSQTLEVDQSLSVAYGPIGSVDEKTRYVRNLKVTTYSITIAVYAKHILGTTTATEYALKPGIKPPEGNQELNEFFHAYGDSFVSAMSEGGEYYATYTFYSQTREEQTQLAADMKAKGIFDGVEINAELQTKLNTFVSQTSVRTSFDQAISGISHPKAPAADQIIIYALAFPSLPLDAPIITSFQTTGYEHVARIGTAFAPIAKNRRYFIGDGVVGGLTGKLVDVRQLIDQIGVLHAIYAFYGGFTDPTVNAVNAEAMVDRKTIDDQMEAYDANPTGTFTPPNLPSLEHGTPALKYGVGASQRYGGNGGGPFDDVDINAYIQQQTYISALQLRAGSRVDKLITSYFATTNGKSWTTEHGGNGGSLGNKLTLLPWQRVATVAGRSGTRVDNLQLTLTDGRNVGGGGGGGSPFNFVPPAGAFILGFSGRSGHELDAIQVVFARFEPATWHPFPRR